MIGLGNEFTWIKDTYLVYKELFLKNKGTNKQKTAG